MVVDRPDRLGIGDRRIAQQHVVTVATVRSGRGWIHQWSNPLCHETFLAVNLLIVVETR